LKRHPACPAKPCWNFEETTRAHLTSVSSNAFEAMVEHNGTTHLPMTN